MVESLEARKGPAGTGGSLLSAASGAGGRQGVRYGEHGFSVVREVLESDVRVGPAQRLSGQIQRESGLLYRRCDTC